MPSTLLALVLLVAGTLAFMALSLGKRGTADVFRNAKENLPYVLLLIAALGGRALAERSLVATAPSLLLPDAFHLLGKEVAAMQSWFPGELVSLFAFLYVFLFPLALLTATLWLLSGESGRFRTYCLSMAIASTFLIISHELMLSPRPALDLTSGISPLLYRDPFWGPLSGDLISRGQSFPSGHTTLLTVVLLSLWGGGKASAAALCLLSLTILGVLYLGLHWPVDVVAGLLLGWFSTISGQWLLRKNEGKRSTRWRRASL